ncbi:hypothetical protein BJ973_002780 [Actinoplanes tereljensis]
MTLRVADTVLTAGSSASPLWSPLAAKGPAVRRARP